MANPTLSAICDRDRETLEGWLVAFEQAWTEDAFAEWVANKLPAPGSPMRLSAMIEMVKVDLERQWQRGNQLTVGSYLERFPELGDHTTAPAESGRAISSLHAACRTGTICCSTYLDPGPTTDLGHLLD